MRRGAVARVACRLARQQKHTQSGFTFLNAATRHASTTAQHNNNTANIDTKITHAIQAADRDAAASVGGIQDLDLVRLHGIVSPSVQGSLPASKWVYLDNQATAPVDPRVLDAMMPYFVDEFGNPHSRSHQYGWDSESAVERARGQVASLIGAQDKEIVWTSGATESNNIAIKGVARFWASENKKHIITLQTEHKCVLDSCRSLEREGFQVTYLPVKKDGLLDLEVLEAKLKERPDTSLVSVMFAHNEIGVIQPIAEIGAMCRKHGVFFHSDAAQATGKIPIDVNAMNIDLMSISGHKIYGPKGIGALYVRRRRPRVRLVSPVSGGGQERGFRSGTVPTPLVVGLGEACAVAQREMGRDEKRVGALTQRLWQGIKARVPSVNLNGSTEHRLAGNLNVSFLGVEGEALLMGLNFIAVSSGSACTSASLEPSYVLRALGVAEEAAHTSLRFGVGRFTTQKEVDYTVGIIAGTVHRLREISIMWDFEKEGGLENVKWASH